MAIPIRLASTNITFRFTTTTVAPRALVYRPIKASGTTYSFRKHHSCCSSKTANHSTFTSTSTSTSTLTSQPPAPSIPSTATVPIANSTIQQQQSRSLNTMSATTKNGDGEHVTQSGQENEDWKYRAPYKVHENDPNFKVRYEGGCHCGKVKYQLSREKPLDAKYCHCTTCQILHAAPFQWAAVFHKEDINFTHGHHDMVWYDPGEKTTRHKLPCKITCNYCRAPIMDEGRNMLLLYPSLIKFENEKDKKNFEVSCHMFYSRRVVDIADGKPKWTGLNNDSELIADSPKKAIEDWEKEKAKKKEEEKKNKEEEKHNDKRQKTDNNA